MNSSEMHTDPIQQFREYYAKAEACDAIDKPDAMCLATVSETSGADARILLLKDIRDDGFVFYSNSLSVKGRQLADNNLVAMVFFWDPLGLQIRIRGRVSQVSSAEADAYFASRSRESRIGAWASQQSQSLVSREALIAEVTRYDEQFKGEDVPRPPHWLGYCLEPSEMEFWIDRPHRLHDRFLYRRNGASWDIDRLNP